MPTIPTNNYDNLQECADSLASFSRVACGFAHELRPRQEFCAQEVRRFRLGCGHWAVMEMWSIMNGMQRAGLLDPSETRALRQQYEHQDSELNSLDLLAGNQASLQGEVGYAAQEGQRDIIEARGIIVDRLLGVLAEHGIRPTNSAS